MDVLLRNWCRFGASWVTAPDRGITRMGESQAIRPCDPSNEGPLSARYTLHAMELELVPEQPPEIGQAVADLLYEALPVDRRTPDPWWRAGIDEALEP